MSNQPDTLCSRCRGAVEECETHIGSVAAWSAAGCINAIRARCLREKHAELDAELVREARELHKWCHETGKAGRPSTEIIARLADHIEGKETP